MTTWMRRHALTGIAPEAADGFTAIGISMLASLLQKCEIMCGRIPYPLICRAGSFCERGIRVHAYSSVVAGCLADHRDVVGGQRSISRKMEARPFAKQGNLPTDD